MLIDIMILAIHDLDLDDDDAIIMIVISMRKSLATMMMMMVRLVLVKPRCVRVMAGLCIHQRVWEESSAPLPAEVTDAEHPGMPVPQLPVPGKYSTCLCTH